MLLLSGVVFLFVCLFLVVVLGVQTFQFGSAAFSKVLCFGLFLRITV